MIKEQEPKELKILFTGGHHTPALAVIRSLQSQLLVGSCRLSVIWVGHRFSMARDRSESLEYREVTAMGFSFIDLKAPRFHRASSFLFSFRFVSIVFKSLIILVRQRPSLILSFGGYLSPPLVLAAWLLRIPSLTHEQTVAAGFANRFNARFCRQVLLSFESSQRYFPPHKTLVTGNPIRPEVFQDKGLFHFEKNLPVVYVTGGKQGSHRLNLVILEILPELLARYCVIHPCGSSTVFNDYQRLKEAAQNLSDDLKKNYRLKSYVEFDEIGSVFAASDLVVSRSGANAVSELAVLRKKAILIPLVGSSHNEQQENARLLESLGLATIIEEKDLTGEKLLDGIDSLLQKKGVRIDQERIDRLFPADAADRIAQLVLKTLKLK